MGNLHKWLLLDKLANCWEIYKLNGFKGFLYNLFRTSTAKFGEFVGEDQYGNKYYQNNRYFYLRDRWVDYNRKTSLEFDASMIPPEWHAWMHHTTDIPPSKRPPVQHKWMISHLQNLTGTDKQYVPYSTTKQKINSWNPPNTKIRIGPVK